MKIKLPIPPSVNGAYVNNVGKGKRGRFKSPAYKAWIKSADDWLTIQHKAVEPVYGPARLVIRLPVKMRGDLDNRIKCVSDHLVSRQLTSDDSQYVSVMAERCEGIEDGFCEIEVTAA